MPLPEQITEYSDYNTNPWLIEFFKESNITEILKANDNQFNELEEKLYDFFTKIWLDIAKGEQLDVLGIHVGFDRLGYDDESYKTLLRAKIEINISSGEPERLISAFRTLFQTENVEYTPVYPAKIRMWSDGDFILLIFDDLVTDTSDNIVDNNGNQIILGTSDISQLIILLGVVPSGVGLLIADNLIDNLGNFIVTNTGDPILVQNFIG